MNPAGAAPATEGERIQAASGFRDESPQNSSTLGGDHEGGAPLLHDEPQCFQALKGNPVQLGNLKLAFSYLFGAASRTG